MITTLCVLASVAIGFYLMMYSRERCWLGAWELAAVIVYIPVALIFVENYPDYDKNRGPKDTDNLVRHQLFRIAVLGSWFGWTMILLAPIMYLRGRWDFVWPVWGTFLIFTAGRRMFAYRGTFGPNLAVMMVGCAFMGAGDSQVANNYSTLVILAFALACYLYADRVDAAWKARMRRHYQPPTQ
ncbi:MAG: hypothetical protein A3J07_00245 [Candidatus Doudnabacteria bacterium RIFCSPLOWO2_02_FULL_49_13]|uniref:Uncharacterized protein n=1 Tax=Candidatus Doudnabacteria bacterium RIFCSPHIGHO2_12_FULL_48_16 TaxID=1817838 RepID=A0A1F5PIV0_9BACT|nr:MAG: hypothetical protein A3B77_00135 [Candidatus Doudnabacteria bacterium RIFCSPHIGHO2_02_FULL_49_24]OGE89538.1 MAG: hypothetical protein A2760_03395 [Candidatus Doudnabacteria bacterium RIFCSPHIGHO2_01_FULL_50_67]OGE89789.1 MAG: hypothetical protein A3E29_00165 [Candidatus Doudnabacteria bacterium RIFCSPHIGHO2_12_FULL_48_16]OGE97693.1 MAG: hypothetical protein A2990_00645 [Candidatus Doudnabacteria bacterium RIFCSPLOWO2_01_FULL_49_40]OGF02792.1 MAG: hypothetical protein A3J07_00245 [Candid